MSGLCDQLLYLLREEGATHVGCATDRVIESFRNDLYAGYKSSAGMPPELLAQFPIAEAAVEALGIVLWPMVEFEADDAIAAAATRFGEDPRVERILVCTPDKDMAQLVRDERVVLWDRRRDIVYDDAGVREKWGVPPTSIPDWLGLVGDSSDGFPGCPAGAPSPPRPCSPATATTRTSRPRRRPGRSRASAARGRWAWPRRCATTGTRRCSTATWPGCGPPRTASRSASATRTSCAGTARPAPRGRRFCEEWGLDRLRTRPHRWLAED